MSERPSLIRLEREPPLATIVLDHPEKLNAWSWESARQIAAHADALRFDDDVRVVVVRAEGRAFCAGVDLGMPEDRITEGIRRLGTVLSAVTADNLAAV